jgi:hypothetical protein
MAYFPPPGASGGWRSSVVRNETRTAAQKARIKSTAQINWGKFKVGNDYSRSLTTSCKILVIRNGWIAGEWSDLINYGKIIFQIGLCQAVWIFQQMVPSQRRGIRRVLLTSTFYQHGMIPMRERRRHVIINAQISALRTWPSFLQDVTFRATPRRRSWSSLVRSQATRACGTPRILGEGNDAG